MTAALYRCYAKVNFSLEILGRRPTGSTSWQAWCTRSVSPTTCASRRARPPVPGRRAGYRAGDEPRLARGAASRNGTGERRGARLTLVKRIPAASGLGGGSSDAAAVLVGLNRHWGTRLASGELSALAAQLGSDVPFFISGGAALMRGRGEQLEAPAGERRAVARAGRSRARGPRQDAAAVRCALASRFFQRPGYPGRRRTPDRQGEFSSDQWLSMRFRARPREVFPGFDATGTRSSSGRAAVLSLRRRSVAVCAGHRSAEARQHCAHASRHPARPRTRRGPSTMLDCRSETPRPDPSGRLTRPAHLARSSNGRTPHFGCGYPGSNPGRAAMPRVLHALVECTATRRGAAIWRALSQSSWPRGRAPECDPAATRCCTSWAASRSSCACWTWSREPARGRWWSCLAIRPSRSEESCPSGVDS